MYNIDPGALESWLIYYLNITTDAKLYFYRWSNICCHFFVNSNRNQIRWILFIVEVSSSVKCFPLHTRATCLYHWICRQLYKSTQKLNGEGKNEQRIDWKKERKKMFFVHCDICLRRNSNFNLSLVEISDPLSWTVMGSQLFNSFNFRFETFPKRFHL